MSLEEFPKQMELFFLENHPILEFFCFFGVRAEAAAERARSSEFLLPVEIFSILDSFFGPLL